MGRACRRSAERPLAGAHCLPDGPFHRRPSAQLAVSACHRSCVLSPSLPRRTTFWYASGPRFLFPSHRRHPLRYHSRCLHLGRMVRAVAGQRSRFSVQHRAHSIPYYIVPATLCCHCLHAASLHARRQHLAALPAHAAARLRQLRRHVRPSLGQHADEPECAEGHLRVGALLGARPVRTRSPALRTSLHLAAPSARGGQLLRARRQRRKGHLPAQAQGERGRKGPVYRHRPPFRLPLRAADALSAHVESASCAGLRGLDRRQPRPRDVVRPLRRERTRAHAVAVGQPAFLPFLSVQLHVLALFPLEFRRETERPAEPRRA